MNRRRIIIWFTLAVAAICLGVFAWANGTTNANEVTVDSGISTDLQSAINNSSSGDIITVTKSIDFGNGILNISSDKTITLSLDTNVALSYSGHGADTGGENRACFINNCGNLTIAGSGDITATVGRTELTNFYGNAIYNNGGVVTVTGGSVRCSITEGLVSDKCGIYTNGGIVTVTGGNVIECTANGGGSGIEMSGSAVVTVSGGKVTGGKSGADAGGRGIWMRDTGGVVTVSGGSVIAHNGTGEAYGSGIHLGAYGVVSVSGGIVSSWIGINNEGGIVSVSGGSVSGDHAGIMNTMGNLTVTGGKVRGTDYSMCNGMMTTMVTSGDFTGSVFGMYSAYNVGTLSIHGGTFDKDPSSPDNYLGSGCYVIGEGPYIVSNCITLSSDSSITIDNSSKNYTMNARLVSGDNTTAYDIENVSIIGSCPKGLTVSTGNSGTIKFIATPECTSGDYDVTILATATDGKICAATKNINITVNEYVPPVAIISTDVSLDEALKSTTIQTISLDGSIDNFASFDTLGCAKSIDLNGNTLTLTKSADVNQNLVVYGGGTISGDVVFAAISDDTHLTISGDVTVNGKAFGANGGFTSSDVTINNDAQFSVIDGIAEKLQNDQYITSYKVGDYYAVKPLSELQNVANATNLAEALKQSKVSNIQVANQIEGQVSTDVNCSDGVKSLNLNGQSINNIRLTISSYVTLEITDTLTTGSMTAVGENVLFTAGSNTSALSLDKGIFAASADKFFAGTWSSVKIANDVQFKCDTKPKIDYLDAEKQMLKQTASDMWLVIPKSTDTSMDVTSAYDLAVAVENNNIKTINISGDSGVSAHGFTLSSNTTGSKDLNMNGKTLSLDSGITVKGGASLDVTGNGTISASGDSYYLFTIEDDSILTLKSGTFNSTSADKYIKVSGNGKVKINGGVSFKGSYNDLMNSIGKYLGGEQVLVDNGNGYCTVTDLTETFTVSNAEQLAKALSSSVTQTIILSDHINNFTSFDHLGRAKSLDLNDKTLTLAKSADLNESLTVYNGTVSGDIAVLFGRITNGTLTLSSDLTVNSTANGKAFSSEGNFTSADVTVTNGVKFSNDTGVEPLLKNNQYLSMYKGDDGYYFVKPVETPTTAAASCDLYEALAQRKIDSVQITTALTQIGDVTVSCDTASGKTKLLDLNSKSLDQINVTIEDGVKLHITSSGEMSSSGTLFTLTNSAALSIDHGVFKSDSGSYITGGSSATVKIANGVKFYGANSGTTRPTNIDGYLDSSTQMLEQLTGEEINYWIVIEKSTASSMDVTTPQNFATAVANDNVTLINVSNGIDNVGSFTVSSSTNNKTIDLRTNTVSMDGTVTISGGSSLDVKAGNKGRMAINIDGYIFTLADNTAKLTLESGTYYSAQHKYITGGDTANVTIAHGVKFFGTYNDLAAQIDPYLGDNQILVQGVDGYCTVVDLTDEVEVHYPVALRKALQTAAVTKVTLADDYDGTVSGDITTAGNKTLKLNGKILDMDAYTITVAEGTSFDVETVTSGDIKTTAEGGLFIVNANARLVINGSNESKYETQNGVLFTLNNASLVSLDKGIFKAGSNGEYFSGGTQDNVKIANGVKFYGARRPTDVENVLSDTQMLKRITIDNETYWEVIEKSNTPDMYVETSSDMDVAVGNNNVKNISLSNDILGAAGFELTSGTGSKNIDLETHTLGLDGGITITDGMSLDVLDGTLARNDSGYIFTITDDSKLILESGTFRSANKQYITGGTSDNVTIAEGVKFFGSYSELKNEINPLLAKDLFLEEGSDGYCTVKKLVEEQEVTTAEALQKALVASEVKTVVIAGDITNVNTLTITSDKTIILDVGCSMEMASDGLIIVKTNTSLDVREEENADSANEHLSTTNDGRFIFSGTISKDQGPIFKVEENGKLTISSGKIKAGNGIYFVEGARAEDITVQDGVLMYFGTGEDAAQKAQTFASNYLRGKTLVETEDEGYWEVKTNTSRYGGGSGGCNAGFPTATLALAGLALMSAKRKK